MNRITSTDAYYGNRAPVMQFGARGPNRKDLLRRGERMADRIGKDPTFAERPGNKAKIDGLAHDMLAITNPRLHADLERSRQEAEEALALYQHKQKKGGSFLCFRW